MIFVPNLAKTPSKNTFADRMEMFTGVIIEVKVDISRFLNRWVDLFFSSECEMKQQTCGQRVSVAPRSHCKRTKFCDADCESAKGKMVCGSDGQFYASECEMGKQNCG